MPVANAPVTFNVVSGGGKFDAAGGDKATDVLGNAGVFVDLGPTQSDQIFEGHVGALTQRFEGFARRLPTINPGGVVNAGTFLVGQGMQPGSYISIFGNDLADDTQTETTLPLPVSLGQVSVSFDGGGLSLPGRFHFISPGQINVQIPWEFAGQSSVKMKVTLYGYLWSAVYDVPLATYSPGIFAITDGANNAVINAGNPVKRGGSIVIYANGLGPVDTPQTSGGASSTTELVGTKCRTQRHHRRRAGTHHLQRPHPGQRGALPGERGDSHECAHRHPAAEALHRRPGGYGERGSAIGTGSQAIM